MIDSLCCRSRSRTTRSPRPDATRHLAVSLLARDCKRIKPKNPRIKHPVPHARASALPLVAFLAAAGQTSWPARHVVEFPLPVDHAVPKRSPTGPTARRAPDGSLGVVWRVASRRDPLVQGRGLPSAIIVAHGRCRSPTASDRIVR